MTRPIGPLVTIGMPVFNGGALLRIAIDAILGQDYPNFELIISDNGSTDDTRAICEAYRQRDDRIAYYRNATNRGPVFNFIRVFELSSGEYFMWASHDDIWDRRYLISCLKGFDLSKQVVLVGTGCECRSSENNEILFEDRGFSTIGMPPASRFKLYKSAIHSGKHIGALFYGVYKRHALSRVMPPKSIIASDHLMLAELSLIGEFVTIEDILMVKRYGGGVSTSIKSIAKIMGIRNFWLIRFPYIVREFYLQKIIFSRNGIRPSEKAALSIWSAFNYIQVFWIQRAARIIRKFLRARHVQQ